MPGCTPFTIWAERPIPDEIRRRVADAAVIVCPPDPGADPLLDVLQDAHGIVASRLHYGAALMDLCPKLSVISKTGSGLDNVEVEAATARGILVCRTPDAPTTSVAEHTIALMLAVARCLPVCERALQEESRDFFSAYPGIELRGRRLGIVGLGRTGRAVAALGQALGMEVVAFACGEAPPGVTLVDTLPELLGAADVVSLHVPLQPGNRHLIDADALALMKPGAILVNTSRGGLLDERALLAALERGALHGAGLDVWDPEPPSRENPLLARDDVVATPHVAGAAAAAKRRSLEAAVLQAVQVLDGVRHVNVVNPEAWPARRPSPA